MVSGSTATAEVAETDFGLDIMDRNSQLGVSHVREGSPLNEDMDISEDGESSSVHVEAQVIRPLTGYDVPAQQAHRTDVPVVALVLFATRPQICGPDCKML